MREEGAALYELYQSSLMIMSTELTNDCHIRLIWQTSLMQVIFDTSISIMNEATGSLKRFN